MSTETFRGPQGIVVEGSAHTTCNAIPLNGVDAAADASDDDDNGDDDGSHDGPFSEYHAELGLQYGCECASSSTTAPRTTNFSTKTRGSSRLFGPPGADGGLYDPPPVGDDVQASR
uniref:Uncharacterized protein n=1 Tax=Pseudictyota dubia TaxID=2749911 RepID=A0A7R9VH35_9STRA|mmetsp:Transcript_14278/g.27084  ORF Transcript_14278/g.27084 Transcript_14278/m.27084 type:complete len:116 (+) Transcript_14278:166-513(+)